MKVSDSFSYIFYVYSANLTFTKKSFSYSPFDSFFIITCKISLFSILHFSNVFLSSVSINPLCMIFNLSGVLVVSGSTLFTIYFLRLRMVLVALIFIWYFSLLYWIRTVIKGASRISSSSSSFTTFLQLWLSLSTTLKHILV